MKRYIFGTMVLLAAAVLFVWGAERQSQRVNTDLNKTDQKAYINYARQLRESNYQFTGTRNRMPLYPLLMSLAYQPGMDDDDFFEAGKRVNIGLALAVLALTWGVLWFYVNPFDATIAALVTALTVLIYKAPYFQAEILFYGLSFVLFVLLLALVSRPRLVVAVAAGVVAALAHLTKASILPAVALAVACISLLMLLRAFKERPAAESLWQQVKGPVLSLLVFGAVFLAILFPYLRTSKEIYGHYFYNVNSTFYFWYDSWNDVEQGTKAHGDRDGWPDMPPEDTPSIAKYLREHTVQQMLTRIGWGLGVVAYSAAVSSGYLTFVLLYLLFLGILLWQHRVAFWRNVVQSKRLPAVIFVAGYFIGYLLLYAWFTPINAGSRFTLALFLPAMFVFTRLIDYAQRHQWDVTILGAKIPAAALNRFVLLLLVIYLITDFPFKVGSFYGGY